jgi:hypothetical protein
MFIATGFSHIADECVAKADSKASSYPLLKSDGN